MCKSTSTVDGFQHCASLASHAGDTVSVVLRERLNSSTVYYYTVSAVSGDVAVTMQGTFITVSNGVICNCLILNIAYMYCIHVLHT